MLSMTRHDAAMKAFRQGGAALYVAVWRTLKFGGYIRARGAPVKETKYLARSMIWGGLLPLAVGMARLFIQAHLLFCCSYPLCFISHCSKERHRIAGFWQYAFFMTIVPFAQLEGNLRYFGYHLRNKPMSAIEYKETC